MYLKKHKYMTETLSGPKGQGEMLCDNKQILNLDWTIQLLKHQCLFFIIYVVSRGIEMSSSCDCFATRTGNGSLVALHYFLCFICVYTVFLSKTFCKSLAPN